MIPRLTRCAALLALCLAAPAGAAEEAGAGSAPAAAEGAPAAEAPARAAEAPARADRPTGPRRLEDIHIEGEIPAPQVLFVTAHDQRRFTRFHHQRYLRSSLQLGEATALPSRIEAGGPPASPPGAR